MDGSYRLRITVPTPHPSFLDRYKGYEFYLPSGGGKAGSGHNKTSNIQVRRNRGTLLEKQFKFNMASGGKVNESSYFDALQKARDWVDAHPRCTKVIPITPTQAQKQYDAGIPITPSQAQELYNRGWNCHPNVPEPSK